MSRLKNIYREFNSCIDEAYDCVKIANTFSYSSEFKIGKKYIYDIYEIAFLKVFTAWETFLEHSFVAYMTGAKTKRCKPKLYLKKVSKKHALDILCGTLEYPDWTKIEDVCTLTRLYFVKGKPFLLPLQEIEVYFNEMKKVRNAIAHISVNARDKFYGLIKATLPTFRSDITPGEFLCSYVSKRPKKTFLDHYISFLKIAASEIIHV